jgi:hypothetical protein
MHHQAPFCSRKLDDDAVNVFINHIHTSSYCDTCRDQGDYENQLRTTFKALLLCSSAKEAKLRHILPQPASELTAAAAAASQRPGKETSIAYNLSNRNCFLGSRKLANWLCVDGRCS